MHLIGNKFLIDFGMVKATLEFQSEAFLTFTIIEQNGNPVEITETVDIKLSEIRPQLYMVTWKEENGKTITQIQDYENAVIYSNVTLTNGQFINLKGTIHPANK